MTEVKLATGLERLWHWVNAVCMVLLALSGFNIHFPQEFAVFDSLDGAIAVHQFCGWTVIVSYGLWLVYLLVTRRIRFYIPGREDLGNGSIQQALYYVRGIFRHAPHPFEPDGVTRKFNPLQKQGYIMIMFALLPASIVTGVILDRYVAQWATLDKSMVREISIIHTALGYVFVAFMVAHIYLATTGHTVLSHFKMMITGKERIPDHSEVGAPEA